MSSVTELAGFVLALAMVFCSIRELHWTWPLAIASSVLYFFVFRDSRLYAEAGLQLVFVAVALWGWWQWRHPAEASAALPIRRLGRGLDALLGSAPAAGSISAESGGAPTQPASPMPLTPIGFDGAGETWKPVRMRGICSMRGKP